MESQGPSDVAKWRNVPLSVLLVLALNTYRGANLPNTVGYEDAENDLEDLLRPMQKARVLIRTSTIESCLWSCNMLNQKFWHPRGHTFTKFLKEVLRKDEEFDRTYHWIKKKQKEGKDV